jgi:hypothetical protein
VSRDLRRLADSLANDRKLSKRSVLKALQEALRRAREGQVPEQLKNARILTLHLPDGTQALIIPDFHTPANDCQ